jgi:hypothetical protein
VLLPGRGDEPGAPSRIFVVSAGTAVAILKGAWNVVQLRSGKVMT